MYKSFRPEKLPPDLVLNDDIIKYLVEANKELMKLDTAAKLIPNIDLFIPMYVRKEALIHYQFETIHPFLDGNGRIGRLMILLYLMQQGILEKPVIYASYFLKKNQVEYYDRISEVRRTGNYEQWVKFFLEAVAAAAADSVKSIEKMSDLHKNHLQILPKSNRAKDNVKAYLIILNNIRLLMLKKHQKI